MPARASPGRAARARPRRPAPGRRPGVTAPISALNTHPAVLDPGERPARRHQLGDPGPVGSAAVAGAAGETPTSSVNIATQAGSSTSSSSGAPGAPAGRPAPAAAPSSPSAAGARGPRGPGPSAARAASHSGAPSSRRADDRGAAAARAGGPGRRTRATACAVGPDRHQVGAGVAERLEPAVDARSPTSRRRAATGPSPTACTPGRDEDVADRVAVQQAATAAATVVAVASTRSAARCRRGRHGPVLAAIGRPRRSRPAGAAELARR